MPTYPQHPLEPMDPYMTSIQPGGGVCMSLELWWGGVRRALLKTFFRGYIERCGRGARDGTRAIPMKFSTRAT